MSRLNDLEDMKLELRRLDDTLKDLDAYKNSGCNDTIELLKQDATDSIDLLLDADIDNLIRECSGCQDLDDATYERDNYKDEVRGLERQLDECQDNLTEAGQHIKELEKEIRSLESTISGGCNCGGKCKE